jgi:DNA-directed RNA polymerase beta' subunit
MMANAMAEKNTDPSQSSQPLSQPTSIFASEEEERFATKVFTPVDALSILQNISEGDGTRMGILGRPEHFLIQVLPVPPPQIRPSIAFGDSNRTRGQDDLTNKLQDILKASLELREVLDEHKTSVESSGFNDDIKREPLKSYFQLQFHISTYLNNNIAGQKQSLRRCKVPTKSLQERLVGKGGRIRGNIQGKRVEWSARTVISPDNNQDMDEVGIPVEVAKELTISETVTVHNIHELTKKVRLGPVFPHGARFVLKTNNQNAANNANGNNNQQAPQNHAENQNHTQNQTQNMISIDLAFCPNRNGLRLQYGWIVQRYLRDGDLCILNRQPSLRKKSQLAFRVKIMHDGGLTFRLALPCCAAFNADFDGDEMNLHFCKNADSLAELAELMSVPSQLLNAQNNRPCFGLSFDPLLAGFLLTNKDEFFNREDAMSLANTKKHNVVWELPIPAILFPTQLWTGKQLFSLLLPENTYLTIDKTQNKIDKKTRPAFSNVAAMDGEDNYILVHDGELLAGQLCKRALGTTSGGIIHVIAKDHSPREACHFIDNAQQMLNFWMAQTGFSVGLSDSLMPEEAEKLVVDMLKETKQDLSELQEKARAIGISYDRIEGTSSRILGQVLNLSGSIAGKFFHKNNSFLAMKDSGSKGNLVNVSQIMSCVGQNCLDGKRINIAARNNERTLCCFPKAGAYASPENHGFVENSYVTGLTAPEFYFHTMGGREGISDTAVKTAKTGYLQRRLMKSHESLHVAYDNTVRNAEKDLTNFLYGDDGLDASTLESNSLWLLKLNNTQLRQKFNMDTQNNNNNNNPNNNLIEKYLAHVLNLRDQCRQCKLTALTQELNVTVYLPVNVQRIIERNKHNNKNQPKDKHDHVSFTELISDLDEFFVGLRRKTTGFESKEKTLFLETATYSECNSQKIIHELQMSRTGLASLLNEIYRQFIRSIVQPGEMIGALAAESIGEPSTQLSVHYCEELLLRHESEIENEKLSCFSLVTIGKWIDDLVSSSSSKYQYFQKSDTTIVDIQSLGIKISSVDEKGSVTWENVTAVTRHPPNGKLVHIKTKMGRQVTATLAKSFLTQGKNNTMSIIPIDGKDLVVGMKIPITQSLPKVTYPSKEIKWNGSVVELSENFGYRVGYYLWSAMSNLEKKGNEVLRENKEHCYFLKPPQVTLVWHQIMEHYCTHHSDKMKYAELIVPTFAYAANDTFVLSLLHGFLWNYIELYPFQKGVIGNETLLFGISSLLNLFGIVGTVSDCTLTLGGQDLQNIKNWKTNLIQNIQQKNHQILWDEITHIEIVDSTDRPYVYDLTVENTANFALFNGLQMRDTLNTFHHAGIASKNVTLGIPRLTELVDATRKIKTPSLSIYLLEPYCFDRKIVEEISEGLVELFLQDVVINRPQILFEPHTQQPSLASLNDAQTIAWFSAFEHQENNNNRGNGPNCFSSDTSQAYVCRLELNRKLAEKRKMSPRLISDLIESSLCSEFGFQMDQIRIMYSEVNSESWFIRIRISDVNVNKYIQDEKRGSGRRSTLQCLDKDAAGATVGGFPTDSTIISTASQVILANDMKNLDVAASVAASVPTTIIEGPPTKKQKKATTTATTKRKKKNKDSAGGLVDSSLMDPNNTLLQPNSRVQMACIQLMYRLMAKTRLAKISNIKQTSIREVNVTRIDDQQSDIHTRSEFMIDTVGTSLLETWIYDPRIDWSRTITNDVLEVYDNLGIEIASAVLFSEIKTVLSYDGTYVNDRHMLTIVNTMTFRGYLMPLSRHGINRLNTGPLTKASFEETVDILLDAGMFHETDYFTGVTDNITIGQRSAVGTGLIETYLTPEYTKLLQEKLLKESIKNSQTHTMTMTSPPNTAAMTRPSQLYRLIRTRYDRTISAASHENNNELATIKSPIFLPKRTNNQNQNNQNNNNVSSNPKLQALLDATGSLSNSKTLNNNNLSGHSFHSSFSSIVSQGYPLASAQDRTRRLHPQYMYRPSSPDLTPFQPFSTPTPIPRESQTNLTTSTAAAIVAPSTSPLPESKIEMTHDNTKNELEDILSSIAPYLGQVGQQNNNNNGNNNTNSNLPLPVQNLKEILAEDSSMADEKNHHLLYGKNQRINLNVLQLLCTGKYDNNNKKNM